MFSLSELCFLAQLIAFSTVFKGILEQLHSFSWQLLHRGSVSSWFFHPFCGITPFTHSSGVHEGEINVCLCVWDVEDEPQECSELAAVCHGLADVMLSHVNHRLGRKIKPPKHPRASRTVSVGGSSAQGEYIHYSCHTLAHCCFHCFSSFPFAALFVCFVVLEMTDFVT